MNLTYVTGNENKARLLNEFIGMEINHHSADIDEIQSLDISEVITHKAKQAFDILKSPVLIEDTRLTINSMGQLPGTFIKWFIQELGLEKICRLADISNDRSAIAGAAFAYYDGKNIKIFEDKIKGTIANSPIGTTGFGWNAIFIPEGYKKTLGQMSELEFKRIYVQVKPFPALREYLDSIDKA